MKTQFKQHKTLKKLTLNELYAKGWTVRQAASRLGRSYSHVAAVLRGQRCSQQLMSELCALPTRDLKLR